ncbi:hypothetical protein [uncultured Helicobacter sp.]|uniref:hypothetical protein n=1 Tax=uncultured Helicobacter sp. TaxID=175537 RepID=UPI00374EE954
MLQKILFFSLSITLLQGADKILVDSTLSASKASVYEQLLYTISIQIHEDMFEQIHSLDIARLYVPQAKVIEIERIEGAHRGEYIVYETRYCIYALESGTFTIDPLAVQVGIQGNAQAEGLDNDETNDVFLSPDSAHRSSYTILSPAHTITITPLALDSQDNLYTKTPLYGASRLITHAPVRDVKAGEPLEFSIALESYGDVFDLDFVLDIPNVSIYATPATINSKWSDGRYLHTLSKHFTLIAQDTYEIPSFGYSYVQGARTYPIASTPYAIHIQDSPLPMREAASSLSWWWIMLPMIVVCGILLWLWRRRYEQRLYTLIAHSHSYSELLGAILTRSPRVYAPFVYALESHLYGRDHRHDTHSKCAYDKKFLRALAREFYTIHKEQM